MGCLVQKPLVSRNRLSGLSSLFLCDELTLEVLPRIFYLYCTGRYNTLKHNSNKPHQHYYHNTNLFVK
jgi:hypothetical protein